MRICVIMRHLITGKNMMRHDDKGRNLSGVSGNPGGPPKIVSQVRELAAQHTPQSIQTLAYSP
jgi:hypothetical protein